MITSYQHAYGAGHSTSTALAQITDDWLKSMDDRRLVGAVLLDLSGAFVVIDHCLLLGKLNIMVSVLLLFPRWRVTCLGESRKYFSMGACLTAGSCSVGFCKEVL